MRVRPRLMPSARMTVRSALRSSASRPERRWMKHSLNPVQASTSSSRSVIRSEEHTSELQSLMRISYAVFCLKKKKKLKMIIYTQVDLHYNGAIIIYTVLEHTH